MLGLKKESVERFEEWQGEILELIHINMEAIKMAVPKKYEKNKMYLRLRQAMEEIDSFSIEPGYVGKWHGITIKTEIKFGYDLSCYRKNIEKLLPNSKEADVRIYGPIERKLEELSRIFLSETT